MRNKLETLYMKYNKKSLVSPDPLQFLYDYPGTPDREIAGLIAACFAYGNVKQIIKTVGNILAKTGAPRKFVESGDFKVFKNFKYRFTTEEQLVNFLSAIRETIQKLAAWKIVF